MLASSSITPSGVQGRSPGRPSESRPGVDRREPVDVLAGVDHAGQRRPVEVRGHGQLQQHAADGVVGVQLVQQLRDLLEGGVGRQALVEGRHPDLGAGALLAADVHRRGGILADEHRRQARRPPAARGERGDLLGDLRAHARGDRLAVDDRGCHRTGC